MKHILIDFGQHIIVQWRRSVELRELAQRCERGGDDLEAGAFFHLSDPIAKTGRVGRPAERCPDRGGRPEAALGPST